MLRFVVLAVLVVFVVAVVFAQRGPDVDTMWTECGFRFLGQGHNVDPMWTQCGLGLGSVSLYG